MKSQAEPPNATAPGREADRDRDLRRDEEDAEDGDADRGGEQQGVRAVAGEVLADRELEPGERAEDEPDGDHHEALRRGDEEARDQQEDADED